MRYFGHWEQRNADVSDSSRFSSSRGFGHAFTRHTASDPFLQISSVSSSQSSRQIATDMEI